MLTFFVAIPPPPRGDFLDEKRMKLANREAPRSLHVIWTPVAPYHRPRACPTMYLVAQGSRRKNESFNREDPGTGDDRPDWNGVRRRWSEPRRELA